MLKLNMKWIVIAEVGSFLLAIEEMTGLFLEPRKCGFHFISRIILI